MIPLFLGVLMVGVVAAPIRDFLKFRRSNTDALPAASMPVKLTQISTPDKTEVAEISVPTLGNVVNNTVVAGVSTSVSVTGGAAGSACANTPTPGVNQLSICGRVVPITYHWGQTAGVSPGAGLALKQAGYNFIFGHNSYNVFGGLHGMLAAGDPLVVNLGGVETTYRFTYYRQNASASVIDREFLPAEGGSAMALMTCAPWVVDGSADTARYGFVFSR